MRVSRLTIVARGARLMSSGNKLKAPPMVYIKGEEMTKYTMELVMDRWINKYLDTSAWQNFDLSCKARDASEDKVLHDAVAAGADIGAIFKEPTITPTAVQQKQMGLKKAWGSPNGAMRRGWNGITISRDTIHIDGIELGFKKPVFFERHAVGGEYGAGWKTCGRGKLVTTFLPEDDTAAAYVVDSRTFSNDENVAVVYHNPLDNVSDLAHHFFSRCLDAQIVPYVVTKKTVFKWQEGFWRIMKGVFDEHYKAKYEAAGLLKDCGGELQHLISDAATMQIIRWTKGGFGMAAHNYDGDMLTDEIAQVHRSPGFITSNLIGKRSSDGAMIKEYEASHGTVADLWHAHLRGEETSMNPLGMAEAAIGAIEHAAFLAQGNSAYSSLEDIKHFTTSLRTAMHSSFREGKGTRDMSGPSGLTTEAFVEEVGTRLDALMDPSKAKVQEAADEVVRKADPRFRRNFDVDKEAMLALFKEHDKDGSGAICYDEFEDMILKLGVAPMKHPSSKEKAHETELSP